MLRWSLASSPARAVDTNRDTNSGRLALSCDYTYPMLRALVFVGFAARVAHADDGPPAVPRAVQLVSTAAAWRYELVSAPALAPQIGAHAVSGLEVVAGRESAPIAVLGDERKPPAAWPYDVDKPLRASGKLAPTAAPDQRIAALFAVTRFALGLDHTTLRVIEIRLRYRDGCAVWLNGVEVARRSLDTGTMTLASVPRGPEWETFYVPVAPGLLRLGENVLAIEVHPSGRNTAPELTVDVIGRRELGILRGPLISDIGATTATISVETDSKIAATLEWGIGGTLGRRVASPAGRLHRFKLTGLPAKAKISYRVSADAAQSPTFAFHTLPAAGDVVRIGVYGDVRGGHDVHRKVVEAMLAEGLDAVAVTGDMVIRGSDEGDWQRFFAITRELLAQVRYLPAIGNHDLGWSSGDPDVFALPAGPAGRPDHAYWYSLDIADVHLVFLDSNAYDMPAQEKWLDADLAAARARNARAILALVHDGPFSRGIHRGNKLARERYVPILARHHVELLVAGHDHLYQRGESGGVRYIVSGGGGAPLYNVTCGVRHKPRCPDDGMQKVLTEHHYIVVTIDKQTLEVCPRRQDGTLLEKCLRYRLWRP